MAAIYTWGQIRLLVQQFAGPGVSLDQIDAAINARYSRILAIRDWKGIEAIATIETGAAYSTGTITLTQGSAAVTGSATNWTNALTGYQLFLPGVAAFYTVTINSASALTLDRPYEGYGTTGGAYWLLQAIYNLPDNCENVRQIQSPVSGLPLTELTEMQLAASEGFASVGCEATHYILQPDGMNAQTGNTVQRVMLWPLPLYPQGFPVLYEQNAEGFDGASTTDGPMDFVSPFAIIAGAKASVAVDAGKGGQAQMLEAEYNGHVAGMMSIEDKRRPATAMQLAPQYTRHRIARIIRDAGPYNTFNARLL